MPLETIVAPLVKNLGAERFQVREDATEALRHIGMPAYDLLQKAAENPDPEVHVRATHILEDLRVGDHARLAGRDRRPGAPLR